MESEAIAFYWRCDFFEIIFDNNKYTIARKEEYYGILF
jgi:hypothetical protein